MQFRTDNRGVAGVIGAVLLFGMLVVAFATHQASTIPNQNAKIEAQHYQEVQGDLTELQGTVVTAAETSEARSTSVNLGPSYPSRAIGVNAGPPSGQLRAESVGSGNITSDEVQLNETCRLLAGDENNVPTNALIYDPGYNYYKSRKVPHRIEGTLIYQTQSAYGDALARNDQSIIDPSARSVRLYPIQSDVQSSGIGDETYRFVGGYGQSQTVSDATVTIPTKSDLSLWREQIGDGNPDISVKNNGTTAVDITFSGSWSFSCRPVAQDGAPKQAPTADTGTDTSVPEGSTVELDGTQSQATGSVTAYSWTLVGSAPSGVSLSDSDTSTPIFDASGADVSSDTDVTAELTITDTNGRTDTDSVTVTVTQTSANSGSGSDTDDGTNTEPGDDGFAVCSSSNPRAIDFKKFSGPTVDYNDDDFNVKKIDIRDTDGDDDLTEIEFELEETDDNGNKSIVATDEITVSGGNRFSPDGNPSYSLSAGDNDLDSDKSYTLTAVAYDSDGNCEDSSLTVSS